MKALAARTRADADELVQPAGSVWVWTLFALPFTVPIWFEFAWATSGGERVVTGLFAVTYVAVYGWTIFRPVPVRVLGCAAVTVAATAFVIGYDHDPMYFSHPLVLLAIMLPWHWAVLSSGTFAVTVLVAYSVPRGAVDGRLLMMVVVLVSGLAIGGFWRLSQRLRAANRTIALLAVHEDRERLARDLHDAVGSTLTTITVKAGLARRLLDSGSTGPALAELRDVEELGRQALGDIRAAVVANHTLTLPEALTAAEVALRAAGIEPDIQGDPEGVPSAVRVAVAYVVQESVTNVVRHSGATHCRITISSSSVEIADDGGGARVPTAPGSGTGRAGMVRRLAALGATLDAGPLPAGGYRFSPAIRRWHSCDQGGPGRRPDAAAPRACDGPHAGARHRRGRSGR